MGKSAIRSIMAILVVGVTLLGYNNCAPSESNIAIRGLSSSVSEGDSDLNDQLPLVNQLNQKIDLTAAGNTNARDNYSGCIAGSHTDFIAKKAPHVARIEPRDCARTRVSTPVFLWPEASDRKVGTNYTLHISNQLAGSTFAPRAISVAEPRIFVSAALPGGRYKWRVDYINTSGATVRSSDRLFEVPSGAFAIPSAERFASAVMAKSHPRIQPNAGSDYRAKIAWSTVVSRAKSYGYTASLNEYLYVELNKSVLFPIPALKINRDQSLKIKRAITNMGLAYHMLGDVNYFKNAKRILDVIVTWPDLCAVDSGSEDQVNRELHSAMALSLDLFHAELAKAENATLRTKLVNATIRRLGLVNFGTFGKYPYDSHLLTNSFYSLESAMYAATTPGFYTDGGRAELIRYWNNAIISVGTWGGTIDGGWANSGGYGWYAADTYVRFLTLTKLMANFDLSGWDALGKFGYNQLMFTAPLNVIRQAFGDEQDATNHYQQYSDDTFRLLALVTKKPEYEWYWKVRGDAAINNKAMMNPLHYLVAATYSSNPAFATWSPNSLPDSWLFKDAGVAAMHSDAGNPNRTSVYFRSSRFGSYNHSHADQNSFTFVSKGKDMLINGGIYVNYDSKHVQAVARATRYKNALTVDNGIGQAEPVEVPTSPGEPIKHVMDFGGEIVNFSDDGTWVVATGDASKAYAGMLFSVGRIVPILQKAYRTVAYNRNLGIVVIYDWARSSQAREWELNFHTLQSNNPAIIAGSGQAIKMSNSVTSACMKVWSPADYYYDTFKYNWEIAPEKTASELGRPIHGEVHMRANVRTKTNEFTAVTIINEGCKSNVLTEAKFTGTSEAYVFVNGTKVLTLGGLVTKTPL